MSFFDVEIRTKIARHTDKQILKQKRLAFREIEKAIVASKQAGNTTFMFEHCVMTTNESSSFTSPHKW